MESLIAIRSLPVIVVAVVVWVSPRGLQDVFLLLSIFIFGFLVILFNVFFKDNIDITSPILKERPSTKFAVALLMILPVLLLLPQNQLIVNVFVSNVVAILTGLIFFLWYLWVGNYISKLSGKKIVSSGVTFTSLWRESFSSSFLHIILTGLIIIATIITFVLLFGRA